MKEMSKSAMADLELVNVMRKSKGRESETAFAALFNKYHSQVFNHFKDLLKDKEVAKELVLDAFVKVNLNIEKYDEDSAAFSTWLFKITKNVFIDEMRRKKDETVLFSEINDFNLKEQASKNLAEDVYFPTEYSISDPNGTVETDIITSERNKQVDGIVNSMKNKRLSEVIKLRYYENLSYKQIGEATNQSVPMVKALLFRAKTLLKEDLKKANIKFTA